jgi:hypothetical protein
LEADHRIADAERHVAETERRIDSYERCKAEGVDPFMTPMST